jgi:hypothetical protein
MQPPLRIHPTRESSIRHAREMRKEPTDAERRLWSYLRNRQTANFKFRRQHPIGSFIVDFCCIECASRHLARQIRMAARAQPPHVPLPCVPLSTQYRRRYDIWSLL